MSPAASGNGLRPHIDLNKVLGARAAVRDVTVGKRTWQFAPLNLFVAKLLDEEKAEEAFRALIIGSDQDVDDFLSSVPALELGNIVVAIYGADAVGEASAPSGTSRPSKAVSKPSKRTSSRKAST